MDAGSDADQAQAGQVGLVTRPPAGIARGVWEAPPWFFWTALAVGILAAGGYVGWRFRQRPARSGGAARR